MLFLIPIAGSGASDTIVRGLLGAHITGRSLDAAFFLAVTPALVSDLWCFSIETEEEVTLVLT